MNQSISKQIKKSKGRVFDDKRKLEFAKDVTRLHRYTKAEIASFFGTSRQAIDYHMQKEQHEKK